MLSPLSGQLLAVVSSYRYLGVVLTSSLRWDAHLAHLISRGHRLFAQSASWAHSEGLHASFTHFLPTTYVLPSAIFGAAFIGDCTRSLAHLDFAQQRWGRHLLGWAPLRYFANLRFPTVSACLLVELWLYSADSTRSPQELACHSPPQSSLSHCTHQAHGPLVSVSSPTPCSRRPWTVWCWSALFYDGHPSLVAACGLSSLGSRLASWSMAWSRSPLQCPLHSRSCASLLIRPIGLQLQRRFWHGLMVGTRPTWPRPMPRWTGRGDVCSCAFCTSWRPHPLSDLLPRLCRLAYPVVCSSPRGTSRSLFMDAALLDFQSAGFGQHPLHCARTYPVCWSGACPRRFLQTGTC